MVRHPMPTREALLDAAYEAIAAGSWVGTRMVDGAAAAGVSRQTLYNEFGGKDALAAELASRETERFLAGTVRAMSAARGPSGRGHPVGALRAAVAFTLAEAADNPLLKAVLTESTGDLLPLVTTRAEPVYGAAVSGIAASLADGWPELDPDDLALVSETVVRLTMSYLVSPAGPVDETADRVATVVRRLIDHPPRRTRP